MRRNVLLLQGPVGPFFSRFSQDLEQSGFRVFKVNFNGGDSLFYRRPNAVDFSGKLKQWDSFLQRLIENQNIGRIYLFGDCRAYHRIAKTVAKRNNVRVFVFEEGYIRPNFLTLEEHGVNGNSPMMSRPLSLAGVESVNTDKFEHPKRVFPRTACFSILYYLAAAVRSRRYPNYQHHRRFRPAAEGFRWLVSAFRKWRFGVKESTFLQQLSSQFENNYFVCPLQVHCDMQVVVHSEYNSIEHFIGDVMKSFAKKAPSNKALVFKHHPLDRGYTDYTLLFSNLISEYGLQGRVFYVHDVCLPTLLKGAQGTVLINSTVGMSSLFHGTPVKTLGRAIYDIPGLTAQKSLDSFWKKSGKVDSSVFDSFRNYLIKHNQINGSLYRKLASAKNFSGMVWSDSIASAHRYVEEFAEAPAQPQLKLVAGLDIDRQNEIDADERLDDRDAA